MQLSNAYESGDRGRSLAIQSRLLPLLFHAGTYGATLDKHLLWRRGILKITTSRDPQAIHLDERDKITFPDRFSGIADLVDSATQLVQG